MGAFTNNETQIHKQPDPDQLNVDHTNISSVRGLNPRRAAQQSVAQPPRQIFQLLNFYILLAFQRLLLSF